MDIQTAIQASIKLALLEKPEGDYRAGWIAGLEDLLEGYESAEVEDAEDFEQEIKLAVYESGCLNGNCED